MPVSCLLLGLAALTAEPDIVVVAERLPVAADLAPVSVTTVEAETIQALALPAAADLLRLTPGLTVASAGPRGSQTQVRIRGAEANHSLLFVDRIRFNDPAAGNEARFELLTSDILSRLEIVRGPQSALWGAEALGGVIAVETPDPRAARGLAALAEYGSLASARLFARHGIGSENAALTAAAGWQRSRGIDSFGGGGERDGFETLVASLKGRARTGPVELGFVGHWIAGTSAYDGYDPVTFRRADTLDRTENRIGAVGAHAVLRRQDWEIRGDASYLDSANRNLLGPVPLNRTSGRRLTLNGQVSRRLGGHQLVAAAEHQDEGFAARDTLYFGGTDQDRTRRVTALIGEWRAQWSESLTTDVAVRHDDFSAFADATTMRAAIVLAPTRRLSVHANYGEGIAQPTFFDLYGFFPGSFAGNPGLRPERGRSFEAGLRYRGNRLGLALTGFTARLRDEIVDVFDPLTFRSSTDNATGTSRRRGVEAEARLRIGRATELGANYSFVDSREALVAGAAQRREVRRPRHSFNLVATGQRGPVRWGAAAAYVGARRDSDFDVFPALPVRLDPYLLASLSVAVRVAPPLELFARAENGFDADYQDAVGYRTAGRTVHAGVRVAFGD